VTVDSIAPYATIEEFSIALADKWRVGSAQEDNGALLIVAVQERRVRIEVGYGLEGILPDGRVGAILEQAVIPPLSSGDYGGGLLAGAQAVAGYVAQEYDLDLSEFDVRVPTADTRRSGRRSSGGGEFIFYLILVLVFGGGRFFFWPLLFMGRRRGFYGGGFGSHRGGGFGGFGGGGGFGGFGGGGFGGGGASRGF
jgi:uncharacterized protein